MREALRTTAGRSLRRRIVAAGPETVLAVVALIVQGTFLIVGMPGQALDHPIEAAPAGWLILTGGMGVAGALAWLLGFRWGRGEPQKAAAWDRFGAVLQAMGWIGSAAVILVVPVLPFTTAVVHLGAAAAWLMRWHATGLWLKRVDLAHQTITGADTITGPRPVVPPGTAEGK